MAYQASLGLVALTRFGYGPRGDGDTAVASADPRGLLRAELAQPGIALLSGPDLPTTRAALEQVFALRAMRQAEKAEAQKAGAEMVAAHPTKDPSEAATSAAPAAGEAEQPDGGGKPIKPQQIVYRSEALARARRAIEGRVGFVERLVAFWSNHFCVSAAKGPFARATAGAFEREAIRPHLLGRFADMLLAAESHPAMLHSLDNVRSIGPNSPVGQRVGRGLNENFGREILELHTLGVGSGYGQADVTNLALILTGWTVVGPKGALGDPGAFVFRENAHEPGPIELLGKTYAQQGPAQGAAALLALARHPATAIHVAGKLARAFVADDAPPALVGRLAKTFRDTDGDLRALAVALVEAPESWVLAPGRVRDPYQFLVGAHRLLAHVPEQPGAILEPLRQMGMPLWTPPGPDGFPTSAAAWASPEGMKLRLDYAAQLGERLKEPPNPSDLLDALCGGRPSVETRAAVAHAASRSQGLALILMSPEMQRS